MKYLALCIAVLLCLAPGAGNARELRAGPLAGELLVPEGAPLATVLIIPGSGPVNRDGDLPGMRPGIYRLLGEELAQQGIASLRIDKRGMYQSAAPGLDPNAVTLGTYAQDVRNWVDVLREQTGASCVWVLGHSEGGLVALKAAAEPGGMCGLVLAACPGRPMAEVLREQLRNNPANAPVLPDALRAIDELEAGRTVDISGMHPALGALFAPSAQAFIMDTMRFDPVQRIRNIRVPVLIVQGDNDVQVGVEDAKRLHTAAPGSELAVLAGVSHALKVGGLETYAKHALPLAPDLTPAIARFIERYSRKGVAGD